jgi:small subunit ribosomal protein S4e
MGTDSVRHQKRLAAPISFPIARKPFKFTFHGQGGARPIKEGIPLGLLIRDHLNLVKNLKELKTVLNKGQVLVDGKPRSSPKWIVGPNDVMSIPSINAYYRLVPWVGRRKIKVVPIDEKDSHWKLSVIKNKTTVKGGLTQLNLDDGRNILLSSDDNPEKYSTHGTLKIEVPSQKILDYYPFELNAPVLISKGTNTGLSGNLQYLEKRIGKNRSIAIVESGEDRVITAMENIIIVGKDKIEIPVYKPEDESKS